jgi:hypothetical protein
VSLSSLKNYLILKVAPTPGKMIQFDVSQKETKILKKTMAFIESCVSLSVSCSLLQNKNLLVEIKDAYMSGQDKSQ